MMTEEELYKELVLDKARALLDEYVNEKGICVPYPYGWYETIDAALAYARAREDELEEFEADK